MSLTRLGLITAALGASALLIVEQTITVQRTRIDIRQEKSALSLVSFSAKSGDQLTIVEDGADGWMKVSQGGNAGYVRKALLLESPLKINASNPVTSFFGSKEADASAAAKGLSEDVVKYAGGKNYNTVALARMIDLRDSITAADVQKFKSEGGLK